METVDEKAHDKDDLHDPYGIPPTDVMFKGLVRASITIAMFQPVVSPDSVVNPESVSAMTPQQNRKNSRFCFDLYRTEKGRTRTAQKMIKRPRVTRISTQTLPEDVSLCYF